MSKYDKETIKGFADLFRGGKVAIDTGDFRPWTNHDGTFIAAQGEDYETKIADHLQAEPAIGVYPLFAEDDGLKVYWGCVDLDEGIEESYSHAKSLNQVLKQLNIKCWVERSRSKGFHVWVFFTEPMLARDVRTGLLGACQIVDAPTKEINPKQVELSQRGWGNGVRLPYADNRQRGGYNEMTDPEWSMSIISVATFVKDAISTRVTPEIWDPLRALYKPPERIPAPPPSTPSTVPLRGLSKVIRREGPRSTPTNPVGDRSKTLVALACSMFRDGYDKPTIYNELKSADKDWGGKYAGRKDGDKLLWKIVNDYEKIAFENADNHKYRYRAKTESQSETEAH